MFKQTIKFVLSLWLITTALPSVAQVDTMQVKLAGLICIDDSTTNTPFIHIINLRTGAGVISDSLGFFKIKIQKSDSLLIRCIGFEDKVFNLKDNIVSTTTFIKINLSKTTYSLKVINVYALNRLSQFRYDFLKIPLPDDEIKYQLHIPGVSQKKYKWMQPKPNPHSIAMNPGPFSALYYLWSKKGKSIIKLIKLLEEEEENCLINKKFNTKLLSEFTGFTGDTLIDFKLYLNYNHQYLLKTNEYDIFLDVSRKLPGFKSAQSIIKDSINNQR